MTAPPGRDKRGRLLPGHTANPSGRPTLPLETRLRFHKQRADIYDALSKYSAMSVEELEEKKNDKTITGTERMAIGLIYKAFNGDKACFEAIAHPFIGKPTQQVEITKEDVASNFTGLNREELIKYSKEAVTILEAEGGTVNDRKKLKSKTTKQD